MESTLDRLRKSRRVQELLGVLLLALGLLSLLAILSYSHTDATWFHHQNQNVPVQNWIGRVGATLADALLQLFGTAAMLAPFVIAGIGWACLRAGSAPQMSGWRKFGYAGMGLALCALLNLLYGTIVYGGESFRAGGVLGFQLASILRALLNTTGAVVLAGLVIVSVAILAARESFARSFQLTTSGLSGVAAWTAGEWSSWRERRDSRREEATASAPVKRPAEAGPAPPAVAARPTIALERETAPKPRVPAEAPSTLTIKPRQQPKPAPVQSKLPMNKGNKGYSMPPLDLLNEPEPQSRESQNELLDRAKQITEKFREFSIDGLVVAIHPGPVVTTFEFKPEAGVKYSKITGMTDDLSLALKAESVRIDRLPGRSTVGIEVPNRQQETIFPRELMGSDRFRNSESKLTLALGKDIHGEVATADLDRMPHLLIAGATGAGKSVGLNGMIVSMLYKASPEDLRFIMIDTKMIELGIYSDIPHLLIPVVTEPKHASAALKWAVREMEGRYRKLATVGVRNIAQFNDLLKEEPGRTMDHPKTGEPIPLTHMPYIVIVIDEMADLMMIAAADVEESIMRLAQMARAVGIHLILATQRPSVDVITGTIKANFPSRIAFRVSQRVDSRTIIDQQGAEHLLGRGDMLFLPTGQPRVKRLHSGFITETEINRIVSYIKKMAQPEYDETVLKETEEGGAPLDGGGERDEMFVDAVRTVINEGKCSITLLQRRLQLGYARAARIVDMMEQEGVVSPGEGSKPREVLVGPEILETYEART